MRTVEPLDYLCVGRVLSHMLCCEHLPVKLTLFQNVKECEEEHRTQSVSLNNYTGCILVASTTVYNFYKSVSLGKISLNFLKNKYFISIPLPCWSTALRNPTNQHGLVN